VGKVLSVDDGGKLKVCSIDVGAEAPVTVVTNATNIAERTIGKLVCVATVGSEVEGVKVTRRAVGGTTSEGMLCDSPMLGWSGGAAGIAVLIPDSFNPGDSPPSSRPRGDGGGAATAEPVGPVTGGLYEKKMTKEEKKVCLRVVPHHTNPRYRTPLYATPRDAYHPGCRKSGERSEKGSQKVWQRQGRWCGGRRGDVGASGRRRGCWHARSARAADGDPRCDAGADTDSAPCSR